MFVKDAPGELGNPLPKNLVQEKYRSLAKAALSPERIEKVEKMVLHMEGIKNIRDLGSLLGKD